MRTWRLERVAWWMAVICVGVAAAITWTAGAVGAVVYGTTAGGWSWLVVVVMELLLLALVAGAVGASCTSKREDRELVAAKAEIEARTGEAEAKLRQVSERFAEVKRDLRSVR